ncbi:hypothetical protein COT48_00555 [Candidatus Woesearchaeota archaeon CG08_land_8_20_14_0_20_47_9]|nr:MAG: hypothetical protein COT48_00555 [Candidatus Woesearchaeota archaeon CG08_land_8_20_14_0_20_47_9]
MKGFKGALREISLTLNSVMLAEVFVDTLLIVLIAYTALSLFGLAWTLSGSASLAIAGCYFIYSSIERLRADKVRLVGSRYSRISEALMTAAENIDATNPVIEELHDELINQELRNVETASFINERTLYAKSIAIVAICFLLLLLAPVSFKNLNIRAGSLFNQTRETSRDISPGSFDAEGAAAVAGRNRNADIYGNKSIAEIGIKPLEVGISSASMEVDLHDVGDAQEQGFTEQLPPAEISAVAASVYDENIPKEQQEVVKNYFNRLTKG